MYEDQGADVLRRLKDREEPIAVPVLSIDVCRHGGTDETQLPDRALEFDDGCVGVLQGQESKPAEAIRMLGDNRRGLVIDVASHVDAVAGINLMTPQRWGEGDQTADRPAGGPCRRSDP